MDVYSPQGNNAHPEAWTLPDLNHPFLGVILNCNSSWSASIVINDTDDIDTKKYCFKIFLFLYINSWIKTPTGSPVI